MGLVFTGCGGEDDAWSDVTSLSQLIGTWQGSYSQSTAVRQWLEAQDFIWDDPLQAFYGNMNIKLSMDLIMTINSGSKPMTGTLVLSYAFSGGNIGNAWPPMRNQYAESGFVINDSKHTMTMSESIQEPLPEDCFYIEQINQSGNKIRALASEFGFMPRELRLLDSSNYFVMHRR